MQVSLMDFNDLLLISVSSFSVVNMLPYPYSFIT